jgi:hypothetical protein
MPPIIDAIKPFPVLTGMEFQPLPERILGMSMTFPNFD